MNKMKLLFWVACAIITMGACTNKGKPDTPADMDSLRNDSTIEAQADGHTSLGNKDIAQMRELYAAYDSGGYQNIQLVKKMSIDIDNDGTDEVWLRADDNLHGAFYIQDGEGFRLIGVETVTVRPALTEDKDGCYYLLLSGKQGNEWTEQAIGIKGSKMVDNIFIASNEDGEIIQATHHGQAIDAWDAAKLFDQLPDVRKLYEYWEDIAPGQD